MDKWLRNPNVVKVIALLLGILLWVVIRTDEKVPGGTVNLDRETTISNVKVTPVYDSERFSIQSMDPSEVTIKVKGRESALKKVNTETYQIVLDLSNAKKGENTMALRPEKFPSGVDVSIYPPYVKVVLEELQRKEMPVQANLVGNPSNGYKAGMPVIKPQRVVVTAPTSLMDSVAVIRADVMIENATAAVTKQVKLAAYDKNGKQLDVSISPQVVDVEVPITQPFKKIPLQIKTTGTPAPGYSVASFTPNVDQVTVYGPQDVLDKLEFYEGPTVDLNGIKETKTFTVDIPPRNKISTVDPAKVEIKVEVVPAVTKTFDAIPITLNGLNDQYDTKITDPAAGTVSLTFEGAPAVLDKLKPQDIQAIADVSNLPPGKHEVVVNVNLPPFVKRIGPELKAAVEITAKPNKPVGAANKVQ